MVKITLEFPTVDHAIAALGKLAGVQTAAAAPAAAAPAPRKGRSDAGKPRGPRNAPQAPEPKAAAPAEQERTDKAATLPPEAAPAEADKAHPSGEVPPVAAASPTASEATEAEAQAAVQKLFESTMKTSTAENKSGAALQESKDLLARYGVKRIRDLLAGQRRAFVDEVNGILAKRVA